ncbi:hypothetical protein ACVWZ9_004058 [Pseudomonas chlororaphis]|nr:hypothetical protein C4K27_2216 [Pseudomonas chlororaphis subsp. chlororaphis]
MAVGNVKNHNPDPMARTGDITDGDYKGSD